MRSFTALTSLRLPGSTVTSAFGLAPDREQAADRSPRKKFGLEPASRPDPPQDASSPVRPAVRPIGLLLSRDLIFTTKITGTARELGVQVMVAGSPELASSMIAQWSPTVVFADLASGDLVAPPMLLALRSQAGAQTVFVAFGSHVDTQALAAARAAGCDEVMPRSKFSAELPALIKRYLGGT
jgi:hypothetical protein